MVEALEQEACVITVNCKSSQDGNGLSLLSTQLPTGQLKQEDLMEAASLVGSACATSVHFNDGPLQSSSISVSICGRLFRRSAVHNVRNFMCITEVHPLSVR